MSIVDFNNTPSRTKEEWAKLETFVIKYLMPMQGTRSADRRIMNEILIERGEL